MLADVQLWLLYLFWLNWLRKFQQLHTRETGCCDAECCRCGNFNLWPKQHKTTESKSSEITTTNKRIHFLLSCYYSVWSVSTLWLWLYCTSSCVTVIQWKCSAVEQDMWSACVTMVTNIENSDFRPLTPRIDISLYCTARVGWAIWLRAVSRHQLLFVTNHKS